MFWLGGSSLKCTTSNAASSYIFHGGLAEDKLDQGVDDGLSGLGLLYRCGVKVIVIEIFMWRSGEVIVLQ
jgi:hypothetical protein